MLEDSINNIITALYSDPVYLIIGVILAALILYSLVKKLVKLMLYLSAILIIYLGYLYFTGQELPKDFNEIKEKIEEGIEHVTEQGTEIIDKVVKDKKGK